MSLLSVAVSAPGAAGATDLIDDRNVALRLAGPADRIVTLAPHLAEIVHAAGAGAKLVAVVRFSDYPPPVRALPQVGDAARVDAERVLALKPDLVLAWKSGNSAADIARLERLGLSVFVTEPARLADIPRLVRAVGTLAGTTQVADTAAAAWEREAAALRSRYAGRAPVRVFYEIWHRPLLTVNGRHYISDVIRLCGGENVFAGVGSLTPSVTLEAVVAAQPDLILGGSSAASASDFAGQWRDVRVAALQDVPVAFIAPDAIQRAGPRLIEGARAVCAAIESVRAGKR